MGTVVLGILPSRCLGVKNETSCTPGSFGCATRNCEEIHPEPLIMGEVDPRAQTGNGGDWFQWFYHRDQRLEGHAFSARELAAAASRAAAALGLEVFGGDAIATREGRIVVIDLNAWPSFALYREKASERIASYLAARFRGHVEVGVQE